ncbi:thioesterase II family protein [Amycolatopsis vastitatis]|uniref:Thioesterase domain-containing protein n=1 Tax=Amycolatopsis vastitatis TaxID=1905142 RepID=A0A229SK62_9PSEU|nr:thioesterase domain-containing protein [Amycolatopsis vastitatis]OXM59357.1 hypothetical protein CF165_48160 [Amycolatopsis vastitatis]
MVPGPECFPHDAGEPTDGVRGELFCLPFAGAGARVFAQWSSGSDAIRIRPIELPGKNTRLLEQPFSDLASCASYCADAIQEYGTGVPAGLLGHSAGAAVALATARVLEQRGCAARCVIACSALPPHENARWVERNAAAVPSSPPETADFPPELRRLVSRGFEADLAMSVQHLDGLRLRQTEVVLIAGEEEGELRSLATSWCDVTPGRSLRMVLVPGGHFAVTEAGYWARIEPAVRAAMEPRTRPRPEGPPQ